jgi:hypothetical protein
MILGGGYLYQTMFSPDEPTQTESVQIVPTSTPTKSVQLSPSSTLPIQPLFSEPDLSTDQVYYGDAGCGPGDVTFSIEAEHPAGIRSVILYRRLHEIGGSQDSGWSAVDSMDLVGGNIYSLSVSGSSLVVGTGFETSAQVSYQFIIEPQSGEFEGSVVYQDLILLPCYVSTPTPYTPTP